MFERLTQLPPDSILGLMALYREDSNPDKIDLGVGVYRDEHGNTPILDCVKQAEQRRLTTETTKSYIGPAGDPGFNRCVRELLFGPDHAALAADRVRTVQTPGGCGALRVAAELIKRASPDATVWVSDPTWANHGPLLGDADLKIETYPYYDPVSHGLRFDAMIDTLNAVPAGDVVLLHGCCHNPTGVDLKQEQWQTVASLAGERGFIPFIDIAYQGLGEGIEEDAYAARMVTDAVGQSIVASSYSKNFGLYRERTGALSIVLASAAEADITLSQMLNVVRGIYSMPPAHGGAIVNTILSDDALKEQWVDELTLMRDRINGLRNVLATTLTQKVAGKDFGFIREQRGLFSFLGITPEQIARLRKEYSIYIVDSSRINVAGVSPTNIEYLTDAIAAVL